MTAKGFARWFAAAAALCWAAIAGLNVWFDTSGLFNADFSRPRRKEPNQHFVKVRYLLSAPKKYNAYVFGSSRVGKIDLTQISDGLRYYNMTYSEGLPEEWTNDVELFLRRGVEVKRVMLGVDDFSFRVDPAAHKTQALRVPYEEGTVLECYMRYLFQKPRVSGPFEEDARRGCLYDIYGTGRPLHGWVDEAIEKNPAAHGTDRRFQASCAYKGNRLGETMDAFRRIKTLCDANGIELIVFFNPIHHFTYLRNNMDELNAFKRALAEVTDYYDFSGLNEVTTNNYNYYETSHYRPIIGDRIVARIFGGAPPAGSFGVFVTKENVDAHLAALRAEYERAAQREA